MIKKRNCFSFHKIPQKLASRRSAWIKAAERTEHGKNKFLVSEHTRVCGAHFVKGKKSTDPSDIGYVPMQNLPQATLKLTPTKPIVCLNRMSYELYCITNQPGLFQQYDGILLSTSALTWSASTV